MSRHATARTTPSKCRALCDYDSVFGESLRGEENVTIESRTGGGNDARPSEKRPKFGAAGQVAVVTGR